MADDTVTNGEVFDDASVEIAVDETADASAKTSVALKQKISALEQEKTQLLHENDVIKQRIGKLKSSIEESESEKKELQVKTDKFESENKALGSVAARAHELEGEVSKLQHDLITAMNDLEGSNKELSGVKSALEGLKSMENEKSVKLDAVESERNLLLTKLEKLEASGNNQKEEVEGKEEEIRGLKKHIEELEGLVVNNEEWEKEKKELHMVKEELEKRVKDMIEKAAALEKKLVEKERIITERLADSNINGIPIGDDKVGFFGGEVNFPLVAGSSLVAVAVVGVIWYLRYGRKTAPNREVGLNLASEVLRCSAAKPG
ncbi:putative protein MEI2-like 2-like [Capsicum annuum]|nr:putative protein MEI2-like 2-like [Capsicum annuum]